VTRWTTERIWDAVDAWRWVPPSARREVTAEVELAVTPGSYALTYAYGFRVDDPARVDDRLEWLRRRVQALGGTGVKVFVTPRSRPADLGEQLERHGYQPREETEVLVWELRDDRNRPRMPGFPVPKSVSTREILTVEEFETFTALGSSVFGDPAPSPETWREFVADFQRKIREQGYSERFLGFDGPTPVGRAGMQVVGPVARFWGTGVLPNFRRHGVYGALVRARCQSAADRGAELALVTARVGTSGPILKRHGFEAKGSVRVFEARW